MTQPGSGSNLGHSGCRFRRGLAQILLEQHAILVDDEGHHARVAVFRGIGDEGKSTNRFSIDDIFLRTARRFIGLPREHMEVVAMEIRVPFGASRYIHQRLRAPLAVRVGFGVDLPPLSSTNRSACQGR